jgi:hypothetical protein
MMLVGKRSDLTAHPDHTEAYAANHDGGGAELGYH